MHYYPAAFIPHADGRYDVCFPDLHGCISQGDDLAHAVLRAQEALGLHLGGMLEDGEALPQPSLPLEAVRERAEAEARAEGEPYPAGTVWQYVAIDSPAGRPKKAASVRETYSLKPVIVQDIEELAEELGLSKSGVVAVAVREYKNRMRG